MSARITDDALGVGVIAVLRADEPIFVAMLGHIARNRIETLELLDHVLGLRSTDMLRPILEPDLRGKLRKKLLVFGRFNGFERDGHDKLLSACRGRCLLV